MRLLIETMLQTGNGFLVSWLCLLCAGLAVVSAAAAWMLLRSRLKLHQIFAVTVFWLGVMYSFVLPPLSAPDEVAHYISAYRLSSSLIGAPVQNEDHQVLIRTEDVFIDDLPNDGDPDNATVVGARLMRSTYEELHARGLGTTGESGLSASQQIPVSTTPLAYLPQAIGFALARLLGLGGFGLLYLGRLMNLLFFLCVGYAAIRRIPCGKEILFGISLFPMTLELVSSLSYDTYILALAYYLTAVCVDLAFAERQIRRTDVAEILLLAAMLAPCKMVYSLLFGLCFLIPPKRWKKRSHYVLSIALVACVMVAAVVLVNAEQLFKYTNVTESVNELSWAGEGVESYSLAECLGDPALLFSLLFHTFAWKGAEFLRGMSGYWLGNLDPVLEVPIAAVCLFWLAVLVLALRKRPAEGKETVPGTGQSLWMLCLGMLLASAVCISMLAAYTPKGESYIRGIQGRYFLPVLPAVLLAFRRIPAVLPERLFRGRAGWTGFRLNAMVLLGMVLMNAWTLLRLYRIVCFRIS